MKLRRERCRSRAGESARQLRKDRQIHMQRNLRQPTNPEREEGPLVFEVPEFSLDRSTQPVQLAWPTLHMRRSRIERATVCKAGRDSPLRHRRGTCEALPDASPSPPPSHGAARTSYVSPCFGALWRERPVGAVRESLPLGQLRFVPRGAHARACRRRKTRGSV